MKLFNHPVIQSIELFSKALSFDCGRCNQRGLLFQIGSKRFGLSSTNKKDRYVTVTFFVDSIDIYRHFLYNKHRADSPRISSPLAIKIDGSSG